MPVGCRRWVTLALVGAGVGMAGWLARLWLAPFPKGFWFLSRSTGWVSYGALWLTTVLGLFLSGRVQGGPAAGVLVEVHRFASGLALAFAGLHALILLGDGYLKPALGAVLLPFRFPYRPEWVGVGQLALYVAAAVYLSLFLRRYTGYRFWRAFHYAGLGAYGMATVHLLNSGTDVGPTTGGLVVGSAAGVCALLWLRLWQDTRRRRAEGRA